MSIPQINLDFENVRPDVLRFPMNYYLKCSEYSSISQERDPSYIKTVIVLSVAKVLLPLICFKPL